METALMHRDFLIAAKALASLAVLTSGAASAAPGAGDSSSIPPSIGVAQLEAAADLAAMGRTRQDPLLLVAAARVVIASGVVPGPALESGPERTAVDAVARGAANLEPPENSWGAAALLAEAASMAGGDQALLNIIREMNASSGRGTMTGPSRTDELIMPGQVQRFRFTFAARERADAALRVKAGTKGAKLTLEVRDDRQRRVTSVTGSAINGIASLDRPLYIAWQPDRCGSFLLVVKNTGIAPAAYTLTAAPSEAGAAGCVAETLPQAAANRNKEPHK
jgi:hypothetical protein